VGFLVTQAATQVAEKLQQKQDLPKAALLQGGYSVPTRPMTRVAGLAVSDRGNAPTQIHRTETAAPPGDGRFISVGLLGHWHSTVPSVQALWGPLGQSESLRQWHMSSAVFSTEGAEDLSTS
jgi:hypothetical protein